MILSAHQPAYLPWLGYFDKIIQSDIFIYLDSVQFEKNSFTNRNRIKSPQGELMLTVPVLSKGHINKSLTEIEIDNKQNWRKKHLSSILMNYKKAKRFEECYAKLEVLYDKEYDFLSELCYEHLIFWLRELGIKTEIIKSSELNIDSKKSDLIFDLCRYYNTDTYISGALGKNYLEENKFKNAKINIIYQDYKHPVYEQLWGEFLSYMSILDFWMNYDDYNLISSKEVKNANITF